MATLHLPAPLRALADGKSELPVEGRTVEEALRSLADDYPVIRERLCVGDELRPSLQISVDSVISTQGLYTPIRADSQIHIIPALGGG